MPYRDVFKTPTVEDYYIGTKTTFTSIGAKPDGNNVISLLRQKGFNIKRLTDEDLIDLLRESHRRLLQQEAARRQADPEAPADRTRVLRTSEPGAPEPPAGESSTPGGGKDSYSFSKSREEFERTQKEAVEKKGIVMPGLNEKNVNIVNIHRDKENKLHPFDTSLNPTALKKQVKEYATNHGDEILGDVEVEGGIVQISLSSIKEMADPRSIKNSVGIDEHLAAMLKIKEIIANSIDTEIHPDFFVKNEKNKRIAEKYNENVLIHRLYGAVDIDGIIYKTKTTVKEDKTNIDKKAYTYEVTNIELQEDHLRPADGTSRTTSNSIENGRKTIPLANILNKVKKSYDPSKFLLDESENSPTDQTNSQKSATEQGKNSYSLPEDTTPEERARIEQERRLPLSQKQKQPGKDHTARFSPEDFAIDWKAYGHDFGMSRPADHLATDTDEAGTTRYSLTKRTRQTIDGWLRKRPDITDEQRQEVLDLLDQSDDTAYQLAAGKWFATGKVRLPEDSEKIQQAVEVARRAKVDPLKYDSPAALIEAHADIQIKERPVDPATLSTLTNPRAVGNGIVIYDVADTEEARQDMRHVIDTHFGSKANPWCLLQKGEDGQLTEDSKKFWYDTYNAYSKQVAFQDGRLAAFSANDNYDVVWWDRFDEARGGIPVSIDRPDIGKGVKQEIEILPDGTEDTDTSYFFRGTPNKPDSTYETFWEDGKPKSRQRYNKDGIRISSEEWYQDGQRKMQATYDSRGNIEKQERWTPEGQQTILIDVTDKGIFRKWNPEGVLKESGQYKDGAMEGTWEKWNDNGVLIDRARYTAGKENGLHESWFQDGVKRKEYQMADGKPEGTSTEWNHDGTISTRRNFHNGWLEGRQEWYIDGELREVENYKDTHRHGEQKLYVPRYKEWSTTYYIEGKKATRQEWENYEARATESPKGTDRYSLPLQPANDPALTPEQNRLLSPESLIKLSDNGDSAEHYCDEALGTPYRHVAWGDRLTSFGRFNERRRKEGLHIDFDIQGNLISYGLYHDGRREGMHYTFNPQGDRLIEGAFSNGTRVGTHRVFYDTYSQAPRYDLPGLKPEKREQVRDEITYNQQGRPDGEAYSYSSSGKLLERHIFKNGKLLAEWYAPAYLKSILKSVVSGDEIRIGNMTPHQAWWQLRAYRRNGSAPWIPQGQPGEGQPYKPSETDTADEADKPLHQWNPVQAVKENTQRRQARQLTIDFHEDDTAAPSDLSDPSYNPAATRKDRQMPPSMLTDEELLLRTRTEEGSTDDWNLYNDEYDRRHRQEYADLTDHYRDVIEKTSPTLDDAYDMLATADQHFHYGGYASTERTELLAQRDVLQDYIDRKEAEQAAAEQGTDRYSLPEDQQRTDDIIKAAEKHFGTTRDIREAGYILPDGKLLDFSGRHDLEPGTSDRPVRGQRTSDHRDIRQIAYDKDDNPTGITTDMADFIRRGAIRIDANNGAVNLAVKPTEQQRRRIRELVARNEGDIYIDFGDGDNTDHYAEYEGAKPTRILADIDRYFDEGIKPEGVTRYSLPMETPEEAKKEKAQIEKRAKKDGSWMKAPNAKDTKLDELQWTEVRTTPFKNWFGDWTQVATLKMIDELSPEPIVRNTFDDKQLRETYASLPNGKNIYDGRIVEFVNVSLGKILRHKGFDYRQIIPQIKTVFDKSVPIFFEEELLKPGHKVHGNYEGYHHYLGKIEMDGRNYYVRFTVQELHTNPTKKKSPGFTPNQLHSAHISDIEIYSADLHPVDSQIINRATDNEISTNIDTKLQNYLETAKQTAKNSSKIVDGNGEPLVVYHQTNSTIYINKETGQNWDELDWREKDEWEERDDWDEYWQEQDFYTFDNKNHGRRSIEYPAFFFSPENDPYHEYGKRTIAVYLNIKNPAINPDIENRGVTDTAGEDAMKKLIEQGYDGVIRTDENGKPYEYIAFFPEQIKSATDNIGTFNPSNGDIRYSLPGGNTNNTPSTGVTRGIDLTSWDPLASVRQHVTDSRQARAEADQAWTDHRARREQAIASHTAVKDDPNLTPAQKNRLQNDMIRRVADVRALVSKVREGDRESVKAVTQTVLDLADAVGDGLTRGAVKRLMHAVENATTKRDVKTEVDKAVDAILTQVTHEAQRQTEKLLHTKATKLDPNNIRVAGQMDEHGQRSLRQLNELLSPEGQATDLDQLEAELTDKEQNGCELAFSLLSKNYLSKYYKISQKN